MPLRRLIAAALFALLAVPGQAAAPFPARQITLVVPLTPGTTIDILARLYADKLGKLLGQQIVVMNRPGAGGIVGAESVATAAPDGYTLLFGNSGHSILGLLNKNLAFDPINQAFFRFTAATILCMHPSMCQSNLNRFQRPTLPVGIHAKSYAGKCTECGEEKFVWVWTDVATASLDRFVRLESMSSDQDILRIRGIS